MKAILFLRGSDSRAAAMKYRGICKAAAVLGWRVRAADATGGRFTDLPRLLRFWQPDGVIVDTGELVSIPRPTAFGNLPTVFLARPPEPGERVFTVCADPKSTAETAAKELLSLDYAHYAYVGYPKPRTWSGEREHRFRSVIELNGKPYSAFLKTQRRNSDELLWRTDLQSYLSRLPLPAAVFAANDAVAVKVLDACEELGLHVPTDIALEGVDNDESLCLSANPTLSSVLSDFEGSGRLAIRLLAARFHSPNMPFVNRTFPALMLVRRDSTRAPKSDTATIAAAHELIRKRACERLRACDVTRIFSCSRRLAEIRFRAATGHSILDEIQSVRLDHARELLLTTNATIGAIAAQCGYASESAFRKVYRAAFGTTPRRA